MNIETDTFVNKTEVWRQAPPSAHYYDFPTICPYCNKALIATDVYVGIFPYLHCDLTLQCIGDLEHKFNFCMPYHAAMVEGYTTLDTKEPRLFTTEHECPFHKGTKLKPIRFYGDIVFKDGTRKIQLRCPTCYYSERRIFTKS